MCLRARRPGQRGTHRYVSEHLAQNRRVTVQLLPYFDTLLLFDFQEKCRPRETFDCHEFLNFFSRFGL